MSLYHCKNCNAIFSLPMKLFVNSDFTVSVCPTCKSHDVGKIAS